MREKERIVLALSREAYGRLEKFAREDNCPQATVVEHLLMGRALVKDGCFTVPELAFREAAEGLSDPTGAVLTCPKCGGPVRMVGETRTDPSTCLPWVTIACDACAGAVATPINKENAG